MQWIRDMFGVHKPIIAMCHLHALPGDPSYDAAKGVDWIVEQGRKDLLVVRIADGAVVLTSPIGIGSPARPTPTGLSFVRDLFLTGNGTLFVNNTFVEWAAVQAIRRAEPRLLVARYGVRDKMKPFSSLLLFSQPRASDQIPEIEDPVGSFIDVEQLSHYVWLNAEKSPAYRQRTLHLLLAEGIDEMLAIRSGADASPAAGGNAGSAAAARQPVSLADVGATMAQWLGVPSPNPRGRPIGALLD
jgi:hypothetical protein